MFANGVVANVDVLGLLVVGGIGGPLEGAFVVITQLSRGQRFYTGQVDLFRAFELSHRASLPQSLNALHSASEVLCATDGCRDDDQVTAALLRINT